MPSAPENWTRWEWTAMVFSVFCNNTPLFSMRIEGTEMIPFSEGVYEAIREVGSISFSWSAWPDWDCFSVGRLRPWFQAITNCQRPLVSDSNLRLRVEGLCKILAATDSIFARQFGGGQFSHRHTRPAEMWRSFIRSGKGAVGLRFRADILTTTLGTAYL